MYSTLFGKTKESEHERIQSLLRHGPVEWPERVRIPYSNPFQTYPHKEGPTNPFQGWAPNYEPRKVSALPSLDNAIY